VNFM